MGVITIVLSILLSTTNMSTTSALISSTHENNFQPFSTRQFNRASFNNKNTQRTNCELHMYINPISPTSQTSIMSASTMYSNASGSASSLVNSDTIPSFRAAPGLLSPQTVMRLEEIHANASKNNLAIEYFLETYRTHGPMACIPILSNPQVLPSLTQAMRYA